MATLTFAWALYLFLFGCLGSEDLRRLMKTLKGIFVCAFLCAYIEKTGQKISNLQIKPFR